MCFFVVVFFKKKGKNITELTKRTSAETFQCVLHLRRLFKRGPILCLHRIITNIDYYKVSLCVLHLARLLKLGRVSCRHPTLVIFLSLRVRRRARRVFKQEPLLEKCNRKNCVSRDKQSATHSLLFGVSKPPSAV